MCPPDKCVGTYHIQSVGKYCSLLVKYDICPYICLYVCLHDKSIFSSSVEVGEILVGDSIMADKGFDIGSELSEIGLNLNIPPFLRDQSSFSEDDVIRKPKQ